MGAADVIPGVSGGTIAFITGIYEKLILSLSRIDTKLIGIIRKQGIKSAWMHINGGFLLSLFSGIALSIVSLAKLISYLIDTQPVLLWSFFFGLITASVWYILKKIEHKDYKIYLGFAAGILAAYFITNQSPAEVPHPGNLYLLLSGAIAICAMILPGISGSFILVLMGTYRFILQAIHHRDIVPLLWVGMGAVLGLLLFVRLLKILFHSHYNITLGILAGFVAGALNKIWPWKNVLRSVEIEGKTFPVKTENVLPAHYHGEPHIAGAVLLMLLGFSIILIMEKWAQKK